MTGCHIISANCKSSEKETPQGCPRGFLLLSENPIVIRWSDARTNSWVIFDLAWRPIFALQVEQAQRP
jgi:hypothetical protein